MMQELNQNYIELNYIAEQGCSKREKLNNM